MRKARLLVAAAVAVSAFATVSADAFPTQCTNQANDLKVGEIVGIDQPDVLPGQNGYVIACYNLPLVGQSISGVRVYQDSQGTCVAVIVNGAETGCTRASMLGGA